MNETGRIDSYNLFGETADLADVVHCETIATRSALYGWELKPHRHGRLHQVLLVARGGGVARIEGAAVPLAPEMAVNMPSGRVHGFRFDPGTEGWVLTMAADLLDQILRPAEGLRAELKRPMAVPEAGALIAPMRALFAEYEARAYGRAQMLRMLSGQVLALLARRSAGARPAPAGGGGHPLLARFEALVEAHFAERLPMAAYAARLNVSPQHLGRILRSATGQPPGALVAARAHREARRLLSYTNLSVAQVAYRLGYADPAHFSRVFTRDAGLSPRAFRHRLDAG